MLNNKTKNPMKTIMVLFDKKGKENIIVCVETNEIEHNKIHNDFRGNLHHFNQALSFCWWLPNIHADNIYKRTLTKKLEIL